MRKSKSGVTRAKHVGKISNKIKFKNVVHVLKNFILENVHVFYIVM